MSAPRPQVTVVMPTRNRCRMLTQAIDSVLNQKHVDLELIVVDEGSSDDTAVMLEALDEPRLAVIRHPSPRGLPAARNAAIARARGEWIAFLDDDDLWAPDNLRTQLSKAVAGDHAMSFSATLFVDEALSVIRITRPSPPAALQRRLLAANPVPSASAVLLRTELLERIGEFDESLPSLEDWDLWLRAASATSASACHEPLVATRRHGPSMSTDSATMMAAFELLRAKHQPAAAAAGIEFGRPWLLRRRAGDDLAAGRRWRASRGYLRCALMDRSPRHAGRALLALGGGHSARLGRSAIALSTPRPAWLDRYA